MQFSRLIALAASITTALSQSKGFNYGSTNPDGSARSQADFTNLFTTAQNLAGAPGFTSARLYTMIQAGSANSPISAIPAAINTKTSLLLGLWASAGQDNFNQELTALRSAIDTYGQAFADLVVGISVGSEDLYRITPLGIASNAGPGAQPDTLASYISQVRSLIGSTILKGKPISHTDTWQQWIDGANAAVLNAVDVICIDSYPYFQSTYANSIDNGKSLFYDSYNQVVAASQGKPVWVTETGWPVSGPQSGAAVASVANAKTYWDQVGCSLFGTVNTWWYTIFDGTPSPSFGIVGSQLSTQPLFDLTCPAAASASAAPMSSTLVTSVQIAPTSAVTVAPTATAAATSVASAVTSYPIAPGTEAPISTIQVQPSATAAGGAVSQISDGQIQAPTGQPVSQISDGQVQAPTGKPVSQITDGQVQAPTGKPVSQITDGQVQAPTGQPVSQISDGQVQAPTGKPVSQITDGQVQAPTAAPAQSTAVVGAPVSQISDGQVQAPTGVRTSVAAPSSTASGKSCPAALTGTWEYPHLIVPVNKEQPSTAYGTQYFGTINSTVSTIFNFDIPASYAGKTCSLVFLFPTKDQLETSDYTYSGEGGIDVYELSSPATQQTTYSSAPAGTKVGSLPSVKPGNSYTVLSHQCGAGQRVGFEFEATGSFALNYFQDYNPSPLGAYVVAC